MSICVSTALTLAALGTDAISGFLLNPSLCLLLQG